MARANVQLRIAEVINVRLANSAPDAQGRVVKVHKADLALDGASVQVELAANLIELPIGASGIGYFSGRPQLFKRQFGKSFYDSTAVSLDQLFQFTPDKKEDLPAFPPSAAPSLPTAGSNKK